MSSYKADAMAANNNNNVAQIDTQKTGEKKLNMTKRTKRLILSIQGMTCSACVNTIQKQVKKYFESAKMISDHNITFDKCDVTLVTEECIVEYSYNNDNNSRLDNSVIINEVVEVVEDCGFDCTLIDEEEDEENPGLDQQNTKDDTVLVKTVNFQVFGMTCAACTNTIESVVSNLEGVISCQVQLMSQECEIKYESSPTLNIRTLVETIEDCGFDCVLQKKNNEQQLQILHRVEEIQFWENSAKKSSLCSIIILFIYMILPMILMKFTREDNKNSMIGTFPYVEVGIPGLYFSDLIGLLVASYVQFVLGKNFYKSTFASLKHWTGTMDTLVCLSTTLVYTFSVVSMLRNMIVADTSLTMNTMMNDNPDMMNNGHMPMNNYSSRSQGNMKHMSEKSMPNVLFETSSMLITFISIGKYLENRAKAKTSTALSKFMTMTPTTCLFYNQEDNSSKKIDVELLEENDLVEIKPGMRIPCDGIIVQGESEIDESIITGESNLLYKTINDEVIQGSINSTGHFIFKALKVGDSTKLSQIIKVMKRAQLSKAPIQKYADYIASKFVPVVIALSLFTFFTWILICKFIAVPMIFENSEYGYIYKCFQLSISVVVIACPCALGLAAPTSVIVGTGVAASNGVLLKGGEILQKVSELNCFVFDKTGTLTMGKMNVESFEFVQDFKKSDKNSATNNKNKWNEKEIWGMCHVVESLSDHPVAKSILRFTASKLENMNTFKVLKSDIIMGQGIKTMLGYNNDDGFKSVEVCLGNSKLFSDVDSVRDLLIESGTFDLSKHENDYKTVTYLSINNELVGRFVIDDYYQEDTFSVIKYLASQKNDIYMCTGDNENVARKVAQDLGIPVSNVFANVSPIEKADLVKRLQEEEGKTVGFVGDGINDSVALVQADIGISVSNGTDMAIEASDIVLLQSAGSKGDTETDEHNGSLKGLVYAIDISVKTFNKIKSNFFWSVVYNALMLPIAMGVLVPFGITFNPMFAGAAMICSSISVVFNSLLLKNWQKPELNAQSRWSGYSSSSTFSTGKNRLVSLFNSITQNRFSSERQRESNESLIPDINSFRESIEMEQV